MNLSFKNFTKLNVAEHKKILSIRNLEHIRVNMKSNELIELDNHLQWVERLKSDNKNIYYGVSLDEEIVGAIYITTIDYDTKVCTWGLYFKEHINPFVSSISTYLIFEKIYNELGIKEIQLEVEASNTQAYRFDANFGFKEYDKYNEKQKTYIKMSMDADIWEDIKLKGLVKSVAKKIDKIEYKFI